LKSNVHDNTVGGIPMFQFLFGVAFGAAGYWAWQSFGRDLLGMGGDQGESTYGGFSSSPTSTSSYGTTGTGSTGGTGSTASTSGGGSPSTTTGYTGGSTTGTST
jgi:ribose/xylose/arabinose/galactoside ABC-type transport system permease subunit